MATLPKKDGGVRTVAIATSLYRLLMELDHDEVKEFAEAKAYSRDSATAGASAVHAAEDRALEAEVARLEEKHTLTLLWDLKKFFDSISVKKLFAEAYRLGFPIKQLALSMAVHHAPRRLKLGAAIGQPILRLGRSILAGCKRSTDLARVYTLRLVSALAESHPLVTLYQHVDDISNLVVASSTDHLVSAAVEYAKDFARMVAALQLTISDKSTAYPTVLRHELSPRKSPSSGIPDEGGGAWG